MLQRRRTRSLTNASEAALHRARIVERLYAIAKDAQLEPERFVAERDAFLASLSEFDRAYVLGVPGVHREGFFPARARPKQLMPPRLTKAGIPWSTWLLLAGRGFGKTEVGAASCHDHAAARPDGEIVIVTRTNKASDENPVLYGKSGILTRYRPGFRPTYISSAKRLTWPNGCYAQLFSAEVPDQIRGPNATFAWCEEMGAWDGGGMLAWSNVRATLRVRAAEGQDRPRAVITTTPKPTELLKRLVKSPRVWVTSGHQRENVALDEEYFADFEDEFGGTRLYRQEAGGELLEDAPGALWKSEWFEAPGFVCPAPETLARVVVAVDPAVTSDPDSDETGIVVVGSDYDGDCWVLADLSGKYSPETWARVAVSAYHEWKADSIVGESNNGGDLVERNIRVEDENVAYEKVTASRGKAIRAEPVAAMYERGRVHHIRRFGLLEDQLVGWSPLKDSRGRVPKSPDRLDAVVWGVTSMIEDSHAEVVHGAMTVNYDLEDVAG